MMESKTKIVWQGRILPGKKEEYISRHKDIWPEMVENLKDQGISNYSIFCCGDRLIGYYECDDTEKLRRVKAENPVAKKWAESMDGIMEIDKTGDGSGNEVFEQIFYLE